ncbi:hypothetical protein MYCTH_2301516 [Thermothelomyces thermophilus ATCC 42464]|uniref:Uncharacterized protein n=1 Tax=Thermothelomyces thermophilus (strain ATCC 42464 / BCRC 31852 / DSM 1799) TaxID=573729 RepID=G2Q9N2_THET4|nr:uncharacterized protein MYCTH_2301516 [Thermothelomyces thermophilus ATCC 42464]AEO56491.1 hypothetical protein MYCTH_2301516 [Thermothelomyces thermophilus ATCC 42464]
MKPTRASRFRQAAGGPGNGSDNSARHAGITTKRTPSCSVSPAARGKQQRRQAELDQDTYKGESEVSASVPRYMKPTAASHLKRCGPQPPPRETPQNRKQQQQRQKQSLFRGRTSPSALDHPLWQKLQKRTKQPVVARGGQDSAAASASPSLLASSIGSRDTVLAGSTVAENSPASSTT